MQNEKVFAELLAGWKGEVLALQQANEVTQQALTNPHPREAVATELNRRIKALHEQTSRPPIRKRPKKPICRTPLINLQNSHGLPETEHLKNLVAMRQKQIALVGPYAQLNKTSRSLRSNATLRPQFCSD